MHAILIIPTMNEVGLLIFFGRLCIFLTSFCTLENSMVIPTKKTAKVHDENLRLMIIDQHIYTRIS